MNSNSTKYQKFSINIQKLTSQCKKLKYFLNHELDFYLTILIDFSNLLKKNSKIHIKKRNCAMYENLYVQKNDVVFLYKESKFFCLK